jgi:hypothetical protein
LFGMGRIGLNGGTGSAIPQSEIDTWFYPPKKKRGPEAPR